MTDHLLKDKLTLHVKIDDESQIFSNYGYNEDNLSGELSDYLQEKAEHAFPLPNKENFIINIHTNNQNLRLPEVTRCIHRHFHNEYDTEKRNLRNNLKFALVLFALMATFLISLYFVTTYLDNFFLINILDLATWVFGWGAIEVIVLERHTIRHRCVVLRRLAFAEVKFSADTKLDAPIYI